MGMHPHGAYNDANDEMGNQMMPHPNVAPIAAQNAPALPAKLKAAQEDDAAAASPAEASRQDGREVETEKEKMKTWLNEASTREMVRVLSQDPQFADSEFLTS